MRRIIFLLSFIIFGPVNVHAEPVYLNCQVIDTAGGKTSIDITLDEANQLVSYVIVDTGRTTKTTGVFSADRVFFIGTGSIELQYTINRVDLSFQRTIPLLNTVDKGKCSIVQVPRNRKF